MFAWYWPRQWCEALGQNKIEMTTTGFGATWKIQNRFIPRQNSDSLRELFDDPKPNKQFA